MTDVGLWQEYISSLPDEKFFYIMRLYLGEVKTPYNKLRLIEQLSSFIKNPANTKNIISLLDETDIKFLTAIKVIPALTKEKLISFFSDDFSFPFLYSKVSNLTERLLIYKTNSPSDILKINPLLEDEIEPFLNPEIILPTPVLAETSFDTPFKLSPDFLASFFSYIKINGISLKADGKFKKSDLAALEKIYGDKLNCLQLLINSLTHLELVRDGEKYLHLNEKRVEAFAEHSELEQYIYLCVSSGIIIRRDELKKQAQILADCLASIPEDGYTRKTFIRLVQLISCRSTIKENDGTERRIISRFSQMLSKAQSEMTGSFFDESANIIDLVFDAAVEFGLLQVRGKDEDGEKIYVSGFPHIHETKPLKNTTSPNPKVLNINATSSIMLLPGLSLKQLLPFTSFLKIVSSSTVTEFEITRYSVSRAFDSGLSLEEMKSLLSEYASFELPQNLLVNLEEWYNSYSSAILYKGYILKVSAENIVRTENNPNIAPYIKEKLADGVYLLNIPIDADASDFIKSSGLEFLSTVKQVERQTDFFSLPEICEGKKFTISTKHTDVDLNKNSANINSSDDSSKNISVKSIDELKQKFFDKLNEMKIDKSQKESLRARIESNLIISESQLVPTSVRTEILEADGIDFHGKIHLVEASIKDGDLLEISLPQANGKGGIFSLFGKPMQLIKHEGEAILRFQIEPTKEQDSFFVSKITHIKRIRK